MQNLGFTRAMGTRKQRWASQSGRLGCVPALTAGLHVSVWLQSSIPLRSCFFHHRGVRPPTLFSQSTLAPGWTRGKQAQTCLDRPSSARGRTGPRKEPWLSLCGCGCSVVWEPRVARARRCPFRNAHQRMKLTEKQARPREERRVPAVVGAPGSIHA